MVTNVPDSLGRPLLEPRGSSAASSSAWQAPSPPQRSLPVSSWVWVHVLVMLAPLVAWRFPRQCPRAKLSWHFLIFASYAVLPCTKASALPSLPPALPHGGALQTVVSDVAGLISALGDASIGHIVVAAGHYGLSRGLSVTRSVIIEALAGPVVFDAQACLHQCYTLSINPGSSGIVQLIGLDITGASGHFYVSRSSSPLRSLSRTLHQP